MEDWKKSLDDGKFVAMVAMYLPKAFESLPHSLLISKLRAYGLDNCSLLALLQDYLTGRFQREKVDDELAVLLELKSTKCTPGWCLWASVIQHLSQ